MSGTSLAIALLGFVPTYFLPLLRGEFDGPPVLHIHALVLYSWVILFCAQTWLVARGGVLAHRSWGMLGIAIVTAMTFITVTIVSLRITQASQAGQPPGLAHAVRAFEWATISALALFLLPVFVAAILTVRRPEIHKRLMLLFTLGLLGAPIARWFLLLLAPSTVASAPAPAHPVMEMPPVSATIPPALVGDLLILVAMLFDWRTRGRPHPVYLVALPYLLVLQISVTPIADSAAWQSVAAAIGHLGG
jgi:hypothetical protein